MGHHYDNSQTTTSYTYHQAPPKPRRRWFGSRAEEKEQRAQQLARNKAFLKAVEEKQKPRAEMFFQQGVDVDFRDEEGFTALHHAAQAGSTLLVDWLVARGYDINAESEHRGTPLCLAAFRGSKEVVERLLSAAADMRLGPCGMTPLHLASRQGHAGIVRLLLDAGAVIDILESRGTFVTSHWNVDNTRSSESTNPLGFAVMAVGALCPSIDIVRALLEKGAYPNSVVSLESLQSNTKAWHALEIAAQRPGAEMIQLMLSHSADSNWSNFLGQTALMSAASVGNIECIKALLAAGAAVDTADEWGLTALHYAVRMPDWQHNPSGRQASVEYLVLQGADIHIRDLKGKGLMDHDLDSRSIKETSERAMDPRSVRETLERAVKARESAANRAECQTQT